MNNVDEQNSQTYRRQLSSAKRLISDRQVSEFSEDYDFSSNRRRKSVIGGGVGQDRLKRFTQQYQGQQPIFEKPQRSKTEDPAFKSQRTQLKIIHLLQTKKFTSDIPETTNGKLIYREKIDQIRENMRVICILRTCINIFVIFFVLLELNYQDQVSHDMGYFPEAPTIFRTFNCILIVALVIYNHQFYQQHLLLIKYCENRVEDEVTLRQMGLLWKYLIDQFLSCIINYPGLDHEFYIQSFGVQTKYTIGSIVQMLQFAKFIPLVDLIIFTSYYTGSTATRICENSGAQASLGFNFKVNMKLRPFTQIICIYAIGLLSFSILIMIFEQYTENSNLVSLDQTIWLMLVTINTIGYGDAAPETLWGRTILIFACIWGTSIYSLFVVSLKTFTISNEEDNLTYKMIVLDQDKVKLKNDAGRLIKSFILYVHFRAKDRRAGLTLSSHSFQKSRSLIMTIAQKYIRPKRIPKIFDIIKYSSRFKHERLVQMKKDPDIEFLLNSIEKEILVSQNETELMADNIDTQGEKVQLIQSESKVINALMTSSKHMSYQLLNFGKYLMEYAGDHPIGSLERVSQSTVQSPEETRSSINEGQPEEILSYPGQLPEIVENQIYYEESYSSSEDEETNPVNDQNNNFNFENNEELDVYSLSQKPQLVMPSLKEVFYRYQMNIQQDTSQQNDQPRGRYEDIDVSQKHSNYDNFKERNTIMTGGLISDLEETKQQQLLIEDSDSQHRTSHRSKKETRRGQLPTLKIGHFTGQRKKQSITPDDRLQWQNNLQKQARRKQKSNDLRLLQFEKIIQLPPVQPIVELSRDGSKQDNEVIQQKAAQEQQELKRDPSLKSAYKLIQQENQRTKMILKNKSEIISSQVGSIQKVKTFKSQKQSEATNMLEKMMQTEVVGKRWRYLKNYYNSKQLKNTDSSNAQ